MDADDLRPGAEAVLDVLAEGRATKGYLIEQTGFSRNTVYRELDLLCAHGHVRCVHEPTSLWELVDDPRS